MGLSEASSLGSAEMVGSWLGSSDGCEDTLGFADGSIVGKELGAEDGMELGNWDGNVLGAPDGWALGIGVGLALGLEEGAPVVG